ncbi:thioesterase family protein [Bailinhaonella thermotolerans]|nr:thioesterase family protein [Bailinhaonella thermotolerans]
MGDLEIDTAVSGAGGHYTAELSPEWAAWGPQGGYVAGVLLRAAGRESAWPRPASMTCHFLSVAEFGPVDLEVVTLRRGRRSQSLRVSMTQRGRAIAEALCWFVAEGLDGLTHDAVPPIGRPGPHGLPTSEELSRGDWDGEYVIPFWRHIEHRPTFWYDDWDSRPPAEPRWDGWYRYRPRPTCADPLADTTRLLILLDAMAWSAAWHAHPPDTPYTAPNLDLSVQFHRSPAKTEWLYAEGFSQLAEDGLAAFRTAVRAESGPLLATAAGQLIFRRT